MKTVLHLAGSRGHANHGWLDSHHTFSFAGYHDPERVHFGMLRVLNDDIVKGGMGFGQHPHDNMEIVSIPLKGVLEHKDTTGGHGLIRAGEVQIMSAGSGLQHSEKNGSHSEDVNFLQIWVFPRERNIKPRYEQKLYPAAERQNRFQSVVAPDKTDGALWINQEAWFSLGSFTKDAKQDYVLHRKESGVYLFVIEGAINVNDQPLHRRDGYGVWDTDTVTFTATENAEVLLMEVPMIPE
jgi:hypothetical protein